MLDMYFESAEDALAFYVRYAWLAGFDISRNRTSKNGHAQEVECKAENTMEGRGRIVHVAKLQRKGNTKQLCVSQDQQRG
jgi:hypothetical protein